MLFRYRREWPKKNTEQSVDGDRDRESLRITLYSLCSRMTCIVRRDALPYGWGMLTHLTVKLLCLVSNFFVGSSLFELYLGCCGPLGTILSIFSLYLGTSTSYSASRDCVPQKREQTRRSSSRKLQWTSRCSSPRLVRSTRCGIENIRPGDDSGDLVAYWCLWKWCRDREQKWRLGGTVTESTTLRKLDNVLSSIGDRHSTTAENVNLGDKFGSAQNTREQEIDQSEGFDGD